MWRYSIKPGTTKYVKGYRFLSFARKYKKETIGCRTRCCKTASKKLVHKAGEYFGNKIVDTVTKSNDDKIGKQQSFEKIIILLEKRD